MSGTLIAPILDLCACRCVRCAIDGWDKAARQDRDKKGSLTSESKRDGSSRDVRKGVSPVVELERRILVRVKRPVPRWNVILNQWAGVVDINGCRVCSHDGRQQQSQHQRDHDLFESKSEREHSFREALI